MGGKLIVKEHPKQHYRTLFHQGTGFFVRKEDEGFPEPFWSEDSPELLDVSITNYCENGCSFCYRQSSVDGRHMSMQDMHKIINQASEAGVMQMAIGGGNPNQHPQFIEILKCVRENGIVPTYTSNGNGLTDEILEATRKYCGAMAVSAYPPYERYEELTERIRSFGIKVNLHVILKGDTIDVLIRWMKEPPRWFDNINAVIVLNYKPIGNYAHDLVIDKEKIAVFYESVSKCDTVKVGFDSCCMPGIVTWMNVNPSLVESCEAARFSAFISEDLKMYPCSFMANTNMFGDLKKDSLIDIWRKNIHFVNHRSRILNNGCMGCGCKYQDLCKGGCVFLPEINQCGL